MSRPRFPGRMIRRDISNSKKIASLSAKALALFLLLIAHLDSYGKMNGDPRYIKAEVVPLIPWFTEKTIRKCLEEINTHTNLKWFEYEGRLYLHSLSWEEHQDIRKDRIGKDLLPSYPGVLQDYSRSTPGLLPHEVEVEVEDKEKMEKEVKGSAAACAGAFETPASGVDSNELIPKEVAENLSGFQKDILIHALLLYSQGKSTLEKAIQHLRCAGFDTPLVNKVSHLFPDKPPVFDHNTSPKGVLS